MRKHFLLLMLTALLPLASWAVTRPAAGPADGTAVGATVKIHTSVQDQDGLVTYRVTGWDVTNGYYKVQITGLDATGLAALEGLNPGETLDLQIPVSFNEKFGEAFYNYAVDQIDDQAFYGFTMIKSLVFVDKPAGATSVAVALDKFSYQVGGKPYGEATPYTVLGQTFYGCTSLETLTFTENCRSIAEYSFQNTAISTFEIPKQCATIAPYAFWNCQELKTVTVAENNQALTVLSDYVFANSAVEQLDLTQATKLTTIGTTGNSPFLYNLSIVNDVLKTVKLPASVRDINDSFAKCTALTNIYGLEATKLGETATTSLPAGTHIVNGAFQGCRALTRLDLPNCDVIGTPFVGCIALDTLTFVANYNKTIYTGAVANSNLFGVNKSTVANYVAADQSALKVVEFNGAFLGTIDDDAFVGMTALNKVHFKGALRGGATIHAAFTDVTSLAKALFNGVNTHDVSGTGASNIIIDANAFQNTGIDTLKFQGITLDGTIPVTGADFIIYANAFSNCANLKEIDFGNLTVSNTGKFQILNSDPNSLTTVYAGAFINNPALKKVIFGTSNFNADGTFKIADDAFATGNILLEEVVFGAVSSADGHTGTLWIGSELTAAFAPGTAPTFANPVNVFGDGAHLKKVTFGNLTTGAAIADNAFASTGLTAVELGDITAAPMPGTATHPATGFFIGKGAFAGGNVAAKKVKIGAIKDNDYDAADKLSLHIYENAFAAEKLDSVGIGNMSATNIEIQNNAFANATKADYIIGSETLLATQGLRKVKLGNITAGRDDSNLYIGEAAFWGGKHQDGKEVEIGTIKDNDTKHTKLNVDILKSAFAAEMLKSVKIGDMSAQTITVFENAFANMKSGGEIPATQNLQTVELGNITALEADATLTIGEAAFWGGNVGNKTVKIGTITDKTTTTKHTTSVIIDKDAFVAQSLNTVEIAKAGMAAKKIEIGENAFANKKSGEGNPATQNLKTVELGAITAGNDASTFEAKKQAFWGGNVDPKSVKIGAISNTTSANLNATFGEAVAQADKLASVVIGNMTANKVVIGQNAFEGGKLATVTLGAMTASTLTVDEYAFACNNDADVLTENVTIGELKTANFTSANSKAFQGPQADGSTLNVSIAKISAAPTIIGNTFVAPTNGKANYTVLGDVAAGATAGINATAFVGSKDANGNNTTNVKIQGDYKADFTTNTFTNVDTVWVAVTANKAAKNYAVAGDLGAFGNAKVAYVGYITSGKSIKANDLTSTVSTTKDIEEIYFMGSVAGKKAINTFNSEKIRKIDFVNVKVDTVKVDAEAVAAGAFAAAATACIDNPGTAAAAVKKNISVVYQEEQTAQAKNIFEKNIAATTTTPARSEAFGTVDDVQPVTLYTTTWTKANIYESTAPNLNWKVNRLGFSASEVVPGDNIEVAVRKGENMTYAYGKLFIPKGIGMKYKISAEATGSLSESVNTVQVYYGRIDKQRNAIYQHSLPTIDGYYWINATEKDQAFLVRTKDMADNTIIKAVPVTAEEDALFELDTTGDYVYFDNANNINQYRYNTQVISNQNLKNDAEFHDKEVYTLANPTKGFAFAWINKNSTDAQVNYLRAKSLYIVGNILPSNGHVNVIFDDEDENSETTGIENVNVENNNDAIYNLQGVRVNGDAKGVFIQNGKKYVVK